MAKFRLLPLVGVDAFTAKLVPNTAAGVLTSADIGKAVVLSADSTYKIAGATGAIEGFIESVEPYTADGVAIGSVVATGRRRVVAGATLAVGDYVQSGALSEVGTALVEGNPTVIKLTTPGAAFNWRVVSLDGGAGTTGTTVIIERVN
jgi:hypothetical protein